METFFSWCDVGEDYTLRLWSSAGEALAVLEGHTFFVDGALFLEDDKILSWSWDNSLRLWSLDGEELTIFEDHTGHVMGALLRDDGSILS